MSHDTPHCLLNVCTSHFTVNEFSCLTADTRNKSVDPRMIRTTSERRGETVKERVKGR